MKYTSKPFEIEAMQFLEENKNQVYTWAMGAQMNIQPSFDGNRNPILLVPFIKNELVVPYETAEEVCETGDYLVKEAIATSWSKIRVCKKDIFEATYFPTESPEKVSVGEVKNPEVLQDFLQELQADPYPENVFLPIPTNVLEMIHSTLIEEYKMPLDRLTGHIGRILRKPIRERAAIIARQFTQKEPDQT